jgi:chemotaxis protein methyltransferase CheR
MDPALVERFRSVLERISGLALDEGKRDELADLLGKRATKAKASAADYVERFETSVPVDELYEVVQELTITETYFFRHHEQLDVACDAVLARVAEHGRPVRILSAGCSSGEEAYTLAMMLRERANDIVGEVSILGVDVSARNLERATSARYSSWSLRQTPPESAERWFRREGGHFVLDPGVRRMVRFERRNLAADDPGFWHRDAFDVVLCRNVLMYFTEPASQAVTRRIAESLVSDGVLFLGHAETWRALARDFHLCQSSESFYYRRRERLPPETERPLTFVNVAALALAERAAWAGVIERSATRITSLTEAFDAPRAEPQFIGRPQPWNTEQAAQLIHEERFSELERLLDADSEAPEDDPNKLLLRAVLLTRGGNVRGAERTLERLLGVDRRSAGARYLLALCRESVGDRAGAKEQDLLATEADPSFSLPCLHLGLLARRAGDVGVARRRFGQAMTLLERDETSRLRLFGGGFTRDALLGLCRAELLACERAS